MCVRFLLVQPGVVSTCSVTERISFVYSFAANFIRKGVLEFVWNFLSCWTIFSTFCWLFGQSLVCHFLENSTPAFFPL